ncbi:hypothetical protein PCASD_17606 [Puccinia coronata f. sp. avenae]|uniref:Uncharacterized protein n=1 Tax=Puccinia coronata f. sp. avenae TaxID=200324 RepID=A0A2N5TV34_9BASI|nr:hypothetical protein PCASD_17606 [Puccinia coronata f. sp. avenae]
MGLQPANQHTQAFPGPNLPAPAHGSQTLLPSSRQPLSTLPRKSPHDHQPVQFNAPAVPHPTQLGFQMSAQQKTQQLFQLQQMQPKQQQQLQQLQGTHKIQAQQHAASQRSVSPFPYFLYYSLSSTASKQIADLVETVCAFFRSKMDWGWHPNRRSACFPRHQSCPGQQPLSVLGMAHNPSQTAPPSLTMTHPAIHGAHHHHAQQLQPTLLPMNHSPQHFLHLT